MLCAVLASWKSGVSGVPAVILLMSRMMIMLVL